LDEANVDELVNGVLLVKKVNTSQYPEFPLRMKVSVSQIVGYRRLMSEVENLRKLAYSTNNPEHETLLMQLWGGLQPGVMLTARVSDQWTDIGFQGRDPATDFRGMGLLGLQNLLYFSTQHNRHARQVLTHSQHPQLGYSFAIVGINLTSVAVKLLRSGHLRSHFYNSVLDAPSLSDFHSVYVYLFYEFDKFWFAEKPADMMQFNFVLQKFENNISQLLLSSKTAHLKLNLV